MFEDSLIDLEAKPEARRRWLSLPIAVGLHLVGLAAFALGSYWSVGLVPEPPLNAESLILTLPPPPPPAGGGGRPRPTQPVPHPAPAPTPREVVQPRPQDVPDKPPAPTTEDVPPSTDPGPATDDPGLPPGPGIGPGPGGPGEGPGPGGPGEDPGPGPESSGPLHFAAGMTRPVLVEQVLPRYTELARRANVQGAVLVEAIIDEQGSVTNVRVLRALPMGLDRAAVEAVKQWRFKPATMDGRPVKIYYTLTVNFSIQR